MDDTATETNCVPTVCEVGQVSTAHASWLVQFIG